MRLGIYGGSFDPVHCGHVALAQVCLEAARLDRVWFVPTAEQPFKPQGPVASNDDRLEMLLLGTANEPAFEVSRIEIDRGGPSYTIETLLTVRDVLPDAELFLLMGADSLADFAHWRRPDEICRVALPLIVNRGGQAPPDFDSLAEIVSTERLAEIKAARVQMPPMEMSSSTIRQLIATNGEWEDLVPAKVATYIRDHRLYASST